MSKRIIIVDHREFITVDEAINTLLAGGSIQICDIDDPIGESPLSINMPETITLDYVPSEFRTPEKLYDYLRGYELSK